MLAGLLCGKKEVKPIARRCQALPFLPRARMGLPFGRSPAAKTLDPLLAKLDPDALEAAIRGWLAAVNKQLAQAGFSLRIAIDGKAVRGPRNVAPRASICWPLSSMSCRS